jgi:hypothetical protein
MVIFAATICRTTSAQESINCASLSGWVTDPSGEAVAADDVAAGQTDTNGTSITATDRGRIAGTILDPSGAAIAGANVHLRNIESGATKQTVSGHDGGYVFAGLPDGSYEISAETKGFQKLVRIGITVSNGNAETLELSLKVDNPREVLTVVTENEYSVPTATTATKMDTPLLETPFAVQVVPATVMANQQVTRLQDVTRNVSNVQANFGYGELYEAFALRGFETNVTLRNGERVSGGIGRSKVEVDDLESVEVLKGPAAMLYGRLEPGGMINVVTKKPLEAAHYSLQQQFGSFDMFRTTFDATGPVLRDGSLLYRTVFTYFNSDNFITYAPHGQTVFVAPGLSWRSTKKLTLNLNFEFRNADPLIANGIPAIGNRPADVPTNRAVIAQSGISFSRNARIGVTKVSSVSVHMLALLGREQETRVALLSSEDGGDTFGPPVWASEPGKDVTSAGENSPAFTVTPGPMYAAWSEGSDLRFARSINWGESFEKPIKIAEKTPFAGYPSLGVAPNGDVYAVWIDARDQQGVAYDNYSIYLARSTDQGASFGKNVRVATGICPCCRPNLNFGAQGEVMLFWRHVYPGSIRDMTVAVSTDSGRTFSAPKRVAEDNWKINGCPDSGAATARTGNRVYLAWLTEASPEISGVRLTWSEDGGRTWVPAVSGSQGVLDANFPALAASDDGKVELVFQGRDPKPQAGWSRLGVFVVEIGRDGGLTLPLAIPGITSTATRPAVDVGAGGRIHVVWTGDEQSRRAVFFSRGRTRP